MFSMVLLVKGVGNMIHMSKQLYNFQIERIIRTYSNMLFRICLIILCNEQDAEDAIQNTFYKYIKKHPTFNDNEHEKAWLIRVATNCSRDIRRFSLKHNHINIEDILDYYTITSYSDKKAEILACVMNLPGKYKIAIHLFYFENYTTDEIAKILSIKPATARKRLQYGRNLLKLELGEES